MLENEFFSRSHFITLLNFYDRDINMQSSVFNLRQIKNPQICYKYMPKKLGERLLSMSIGIKKRLFY